MITFSDLGEYGRLGNSLFQVAAVVAHGRRIKEEVILPSEWEYRRVFQDKFEKAGIRFLPRTKLAMVYNYEAPRWEYDPLPEIRNCSYKGYFQSPKYWEGYEDLIHELFSLDIEFPFSMDKTGTIHVRRGDYLMLPDHHPVVGIDYYKEAKKIMEGFGLEKFLIISDDYRWCMDNLKELGSNVSFANSNPAVDFAHLQKSQGSIIANSSFSWWGAYLSKSKTVYPKNWFGPSLSHIDTSCLFQEGWIGI